MKDQTLFSEKVTFPKAISISALDGDHDWSMSARNYAVEIKYNCRMNGVFEGPEGRQLLTGWGSTTGTTKLTVYVSNPTGQEAALRAVRAMEKELSIAGSRLFMEIPKDLLRIITGIPIMFRIVGTPLIVERKRPRQVGYVSDIIDQSKDALARKIAAFEEGRD